MLISYNELCELVRDGVITADPAHINGASIDIRIGAELKIEGLGNDLVSWVDLADKSNDIALRSITMDDEGYILEPGQFCLAHSIETFNLPNDIACKFFMRSSLARRGLNALLAMWCDPGWHNSQLTLELHNVLRHHGLKLTPGLRIGQMVFDRCETVPANKSYAAVGRYNHQAGVVASKGA